MTYVFGTLWNSVAPASASHRRLHGTVEGSHVGSDHGSSISSYSTEERLRAEYVQARQWHRSWQCSVEVLTKRCHEKRCFWIRKLDRVPAFAFASVRHRQRRERKKPRLVTCATAVGPHWLFFPENEAETTRAWCAPTSDATAPKSHRPTFTNEMKSVDGMNIVPHVVHRPTPSEYRSPLGGSLRR